MKKQIMFIFFLSCACLTAQKTAAVKILLAYEETPFKKALVAEITNQLLSKNTEISVIVHSADALEKINPADYTAVLISNSGVKAAVRPWVIFWLQKYSGNKNIILHTTQTGKWVPAVTVDSVTSASDIKNVKKTADELVKKIKKIYIPEQPAQTAP
ncbi:MAG: hypothetical protein A2096_01470 [Spirochaetes bacterium GWF1_41_5]|nr:MAG: hypothetical protein A2096_01470 [Spirochaetes bacterium GWF1_41_5]HBE03667.1 hypothetical protein [Spirochaetia bacterium]